VVYAELAQQCHRGKYLRELFYELCHLAVCR